jgi:hypothetical protein
VTPHLVPLEVWADEGRRTAPAFADIAAAIVTGRSADAAAAVALGIARACGTERRVAVADLVGGIRSLTPLADQPGLLECLRDGTPISDIGQPIPGAPEVYVLPAGNGPIAERWVFESARWERLIAGFREVDALLLLVVPPNAPGFNVLVERVDGVVAVDLPPSVVRAWPLIATVDEPEQELPVITPTPGSQPVVPARRKPRRLLRKILLGVLVAMLGAIALIPRFMPQHEPCGTGRFDTALGECVFEEDGREGPSMPTPVTEPLAPREMGILPFVNPADSAIALRFSVELVAANTPESANSRLTSRGNPFPLPTVAPVVLRQGLAPWYRAFVGAFSTRGEADAWLAEQRALGVIRANSGRVLDAPFALLLAESSADSALIVTSHFAQNAVPVYALMQEDGRVRYFVGVFESASQAIWYAAELRSDGFTPALAYRTGRMF